MITKLTDMKNCVYWWFTVKNFGSKCHCKKTTVMAILLFIDRKESYHHIYILWPEKFLYKTWMDFFEVWVKVDWRLSYIWTRPLEKKLRNQWLLPSCNNCTCFLNKNHRFDYFWRSGCFLLVIFYFSRELFASRFSEWYITSYLVII